MFASLKHRPFRLYTTGVFIAQIGFEMQNVGLSWLMYQLTGSPLALGLMGLARVVPMVLFALISGHISDTRPRRRVLAFAQGSLFVVTCFLALLSVFHLITPLVIYGAIVANSIALTFASPASQALMPALLPRQDYQNAISVNSMGYKASMVIGPAIAGFLIARFGIDGVLFLNIICVGTFLANIIRVGHFSQVLSDAQGNKMDSIKQGIHFVRKNPIIWSSMVLDFFASFFASGMTLMPVFAKDILKVGPEGLGLLYAAPAIGGTITGLLFASFKHVKKQGVILIVAVIFYGIATVFFGISNHFILSLMLMAIVGGADMISSIIRGTLRQMITPDHLRGRIVSINMMFYIGGPQLGEVESGILASLIGTPYTVVVGGIATIITTIYFTLKIPELLEYES